jgi:mRNA interferase MazF
MRCKKGDIVLIKFPFTTLTQAKKRPVLVIKDENEYNDFVCFQITSKRYQDNILKVEESDLVSGSLKLTSYVKYDKCFTLNAQIIERKLVSVNVAFMEKVKQLFCNEI